MSEKDNKDQKHTTDEGMNYSEEEQKNQSAEEAAAEPGTQENAGSAEEQSPEAEPTAEDKLKALQQEHEELKDKYLRKVAEFDNYRRRMTREKMDMMKSAAQDTMSALLPVLDDFDRARKAAEQNDKGQLFEEGIGLVYKKLYTTLQQKGLEPMESEGQPFDPELHEALTETPAPSEDMKGKIVDVIEKGYSLNGKIIRHAKVVVGK